MKLFVVNFLCVLVATANAAPQNIGSIGGGVGNVLVAVPAVVANTATGIVGGAANAASGLFGTALGTAGNLAGTTVGSVATGLTRGVAGVLGGTINGFVSSLGGGVGLISPYPGVVVRRPGIASVAPVSSQYPNGVYGSYSTYGYPIQPGYQSVVQYPFLASPVYVNEYIPSSVQYKYPPEVSAVDNGVTYYKYSSPGYVSEYVSESIPVAYKAPPVYYKYAGKDAIHQQLSSASVISGKSLTPYASEGILDKESIVKKEEKIPIVKAVSEIEKSVDPLFIGLPDGSPPQSTHVDKVAFVSNYVPIAAASISGSGISILGYPIGSKSFADNFDPIERVTAVLVRFADEIRSVEQIRIKQQVAAIEGHGSPAAQDVGGEVVPLDNRRFQILLADLAKLEDNIRTALSNAASNRQWRVWLRLNPILVLTRNIRRSTERLRSRMVYVSTLATMERLATDAVEQFNDVALSGSLTGGVPLAPLVTLQPVQGSAPQVVLHQPPVVQQGNGVFSGIYPQAQQVAVPVYPQQASPVLASIFQPIVQPSVIPQPPSQPLKHVGEAGQPVAAAPFPDPHPIAEPKVEISHHVSEPIVIPSHVIAPEEAIVGKDSGIVAPIIIPEGDGSPVASAPVQEPVLVESKAPALV